MTKISEFASWLASTEGPTSFEYHRGRLAIDCDESPDARTVCVLRDMAIEAETAGKVALVQRRIDEIEFSYIAQRRRRK
jgi:hypothetical protein